MVAAEMKAGHAEATVCTDSCFPECISVMHMEVQDIVRTMNQLRIWPLITIVVRK